MDQFLALAKKAVETYTKNGEVIKPPHPLSEEFQKRAGVFVSLHKVSPTFHPIPSLPKKGLSDTLHHHELYDGYQPVTHKEELRGCIGTFIPVRKNVALEIIHNAIDSATRDPRFFPTTPSELPFLRYSVDVLSWPEPVENITELDVKKYGLIVEATDGRKGLLLPDLEGVEKIEQQIEICQSKAGIIRGEKISIQRFTVERHKEE